MVAQGVGKVNTRVESSLVSELLFGQAEPLPGSRLADDELVRVAAQEFGTRPYAVVRDWMLMDVLEVTDRQRVTAPDYEPMVLFAQQVAFDSEGDRSDWGLLTGYGRHVDGCFFETAEKLFVLAGRGARKLASEQQIDALRACRSGCKE